MKLRALLSLMLALVVVSIDLLAQGSSIPPGPPVLVFGGEYHAAGCAKLNGQAPTTVLLADAMRSGAGPCGVCRPNDDKAVGTFARTYAVAIGRELEAARAIVAAERKRLADEAERKRAETARVEAEAERKRKDTEAVAARAKAEADRKRKEAEPLVRVTESQARAMVTDASVRAKNDVDAFSASFFSAVAKIAPDFRGPQMIVRSEALNIVISGPLGQLFAEARERVRKFEPLIPPPTWSPAIHILIDPQQIDAPDIEKVIVQRNGTAVAASRTALVVREMVTRIGAKRMIHSGEVTYPLSAFEPGAGVTVTIIAIPASGSNITRTLGSLELRAIQ